MSVWVYTFCWNEEKVLPYFLRHYLEYVCAERVVVYDNESTDNSVAEIGRWSGVGDVEVRTYQTGDLHSEIGAMTHIRNTCWHEARGKADWVFIVDCDEFVFHHDIHGFLQRCVWRGIDLVRTYGFEMVCREFPTDDGKAHLWERVRRGVQCPFYSKPCLFRPNKISSLDYAVGAHDCKAPEGIRYLASGALKTLHFKRLGWHYFWERTKALRARTDPEDLDAGYSEHYRFPMEAHWDEYNNMLAHAVDVTT